MKSIKLIVLMLGLFKLLSIQAAMPPGAKWYRGSMESAFRLAKSSNRPLFLYWGAVWCPPCNQIQKTIFKTTLFKKAVKNYIPVYLNGDDDNAQVWGQKLKAKGYPTMMIMSPLGAELIRLPTGTTAKQYTDIMNQTAKSLLSIKELIKRAKTQTLTPDKWPSLAYYSWDQDYKITKNKTQKAALLWQLYLNSPQKNKEIKARFYLLYSVLKIKDSKTNVQELKTYLDYIFKDEKLLLKNIELLTDYSGALLVHLINDKSYLNKYYNQMSNLILNKNNNIIARSAFLSAKVSLLLKGEFLSKNKVENEKKIIKESLISMTKEKMDVFERHTVMSSIIWNLIQLKYLKLSKDLSLAELKKSKSPYYFMSYLAYIAKSQNKIKESLKWRKKGYEISVGSATRFQWGVRYLETIAAQEKINYSLLKKEYKKIFKEAILSKDAFSGRNKKRFKSLAVSFSRLKKMGEKKHLLDLYNITKKICKNDQVCVDWGKNKVSVWH